MKIIASTNFKHGRKAFEKLKGYDVPDAFAGYFIGVGWATLYNGDDCEMVALEELNPDAPPAAREGDTLEVQDAAINQESQHG